MVKNTRKNKSRKQKSRNAKRMRKMKGGGACPKGGDHNWLETGARLSDIKFYCSKCLQKCAADEASKCP
jgi:hypothetical protein